MQHSTVMHLRTIIRHLVLALAVLASATAATAVLAPAVDAQEEFDEEVPPGNPVLGDDRPGDIQQGSSTNYLLWGIVGVCLVGAGVLLVKVERWEARRVTDSPVN